MNIKILALTGVALASLAGCSKQSTTNEATAASSDAALAAQHVRGTLQDVTPDALSVAPYQGGTTSVPIDAKTGFAWVAPSSLSTLKDGDFIGTATTGPDDALRAVELVIFPDSMRGSGEGHYDWDVPGVVAATGADSNGASSMTNGTVQQKSGMTNGTVQHHSGMTNGTVTGGAGKSGVTQLTISYKGGTAQVVVPEGTPIVRFEPADKSVLMKGQKVFAVTPPGAKTAKFVAIGKDGLTPPM